MMILIIIIMTTKTTSKRKAPREADNSAEGYRVAPPPLQSIVLRSSPVVGGRALLIVTCRKAPESD
jgi:hypothetical protein